MTAEEYPHRAMTSGRRSQMDVGKYIEFAELVIGIRW